MGRGGGAGLGEGSRGLEDGEPPGQRFVKGLGGQDRGRRGVRAAAAPLVGGSGPGRERFQLELAKPRRGGAVLLLPLLRGAFEPAPRLHGRDVDPALRGLPGIDRGGPPVERLAERLRVFFSWEKGRRKGGGLSFFFFVWRRRRPAFLNAGKKKKKKKRKNWFLFLPRLSCFPFWSRTWPPTRRIHSCRHCRQSPWQQQRRRDSEEHLHLERWRRASVAEASKSTEAAPTTSLKDEPLRGRLLQPSI